jgi:AAA domain
VAALVARPANANNRRLALVKLEAHRFAGLHKFGTPATPPKNYIHEFSAPLTLFEGLNGSGKTSLANAIIWALTGQILRPQREPEKASEEFECWVTSSDGSTALTTHLLTPVTPMPDVAQYRPEQARVPADTWVELTFMDEDGTVLPPIRRSQRRTAQGRLDEVVPDLTALGLDPIAVRIGTVMPGLLPLIRVGHESELGRAVAQLTGLSALVDLAGHAQRAKSKIDKEFTKIKIAERKEIDRAYETAREDLATELKPHPNLRPPKPVPASSDNTSIEETLDEIAQHFETAKATVYEAVRNILGEDFDPADAKRRGDLEKSIGPALGDVSQPQRLPSVARLRGFRELTDDQLRAAEAKIAELLREGKTLESLAKDPSTAARSRLYARIATWIDDHPSPTRNEDLCVVCGGSLVDAVDPISGNPVKTHIHDAKADAALVSQTLNRWSTAALGELTRSLPSSLQAELAVDLPAHPCDLIREAFIEELFESDSFAGELAELKAETANALNKAVEEKPALPDAVSISLPANCEALADALKRLDRALRFAMWRRENDPFVRGIFESVLGRRPKEGEAPEQVALVGKLVSLETTVVGAEPITKALVRCDRLKNEIKRRRGVQKRIAEYEIASAALASLLELGNLADQQVEQLRYTLRIDAAKWRSRIYLSSFPSSAHELVDTSMGRKGELGLVVRTGGVSAPAQHVTNASALRASLVGFFLAFWEYVLKDRGGVKTLVLDDPQELLDDENRRRLADSFGALVEAGAQLIVTSYDRRFAGSVARAPRVSAVDHRAVHPATLNQPTIRTIPHQAEIQDRKTLYDKDRDAEEPARAFTDECRVFLEATLGDVFDDPAHLAWVKQNPNPSLAEFLSRLRPLVRAGSHGMLAMPVFKDFVAHRALVDNSPVLVLMNKAHHSDRGEIRPGEVAECADDLEHLVVLAGRMYEECDRWKRRNTVKPATNHIDAPPPLVF